jgi:hypothetical protein
MEDGPDYITLHYQLTLFNSIIDILRNEKPLIITLDTTSWNGAIKAKNDEPVGEAET